MSVELRGPTNLICGDVMRISYDVFVMRVVGVE